MEFVNTTPFPAAWTMGFQRDGRERLVVVTKATYRIPTGGDEAELAEEQAPLVEEDRFTGAPGLSSPLHETDFAHLKPACDVLLVGSAHAPGRRPATRVPVGLRVGSLAKHFVVVGPRRFVKGLTGVRTTDPTPFVTQPITYDVAFGGTDATDAARGRVETYAENPAGVGYWRHTGDIDGKPLPATEEHDRPVSDHRGTYAPMAFTPVGRNWRPRRDFAGTYDERWIETTAPLWPADFDDRYFQSAPADQTIPYPAGGEDVVLVNLTPDGRRAFALPRLRMPVTFIFHRGRDTTHEGRLDTIVLEPDLGRFTLAWRVVLPLARSVFDVKQTIVGEQSAAWHRARRFPGKTYYHNLAALVAARGRRSG